MATIVKTGGGGGGGASLNIDYGTSAPADTSKLWVPLASKPSAVECSPVLQYGNAYVTAAVQTRPSSPNITWSSPVAYHDGKLYLPVSGTKMSIYDIATNTWEINATCTIVQDGGTENTYAMNAASSRGAAVIDGKIHYWGHARGQGSITMSKCYFDIATRAYHYDTSVSLAGDNAANSNQTIVANGTKIYAIGGYNSGGSYKADIRYLDVYSNKSGTMVSLPQAMYGIAACSVGDAIYIIGGYWGEYSNTKSSAIYRLDVVKNTIAQVGTLPEAMYNAKAFAYGQYIYIFGGINYNEVNRNTIYRFNAADNTVINTGSVLPTSTPYGVGWQEENEIFLTSAKYTDGRKQIDKFTVDTPLAKNNLFIQCDFGFDGLWSAINDKNTVIKAKAINAFLGDSNNLAQPTAAYLHNGSNWVSLDGVSMTADMLNALAVLGVT